MSAKDLSPQEAICTKKIKSCEIINGKCQVKRTDPYQYYQVQGQHHISKKMFCYFCIWTPRGILYEKIERDDFFWGNRNVTQIN